MSESIKYLNYPLRRRCVTSTGKVMMDNLDLNGVYKEEKYGNYKSEHIAYSKVNEYKGDNSNKNEVTSSHASPSKNSGSTSGKKHNLSKSDKGLIAMFVLVLLLVLAICTAVIGMNGYNNVYEQYNELEEDYEELQEEYDALYEDYTALLELEDEE